MTPPLPTLLSHLLVAFTIEFDNEFEHRMPHRTTNHGSIPGTPHAPWLVSMVMWLGFMRFVPEEGIPVAELQRLVRASRQGMTFWLTRMGRWWGYIVPGPVVRPTAAGLQAQAVWQSVADVIESRWVERFGRHKVDQLRSALGSLAGQFDSDLPGCLPILGYGLFSKGPDRRKRGTHREPDPPSAPSLPSLLSKVLLAFAIEFEQNSGVSLAICANVLRLAGEEGMRVRDLPLLAGVSKEAIAMSLSFLEKKGYAETRARVVVLTANGRHAQTVYRELLRTIEQQWHARFGEHTIRSLRQSLEQFAPDMFEGLEPYTDGWRASVPRLETLPHYPMTLHRGGFPDGS